MNDFTEAHQRTPGGKAPARGVGIPFDGPSDPCNAISDVDGVQVGYCTLVWGEGEVGAGHVYSDTGYVLLGRILELTTGRTYAELCRSHILDPLGMQHTWLEGHEAPRSRLSHCYAAARAVRTAVVRRPEAFPRRSWELSGWLPHARLFLTRAHPRLHDR